MNPAQVLSASFALLARGQPGPAEVELAKLWNAGPPPPPAAVHLLGLIRRAQGRIPEAELLLRQSIEAEPNNPDYRNNLGLLLRGAGFLDAAIEAFEQAVQLNPGLTAARINLARALDASGRAVDAERHAREALSLQPGVDALTILGGALRQQGRHAEALAAFEQALAIDPKARAARHDRAIALDKLGKGAEAVAEFERLHAEGLRAPALYRNWAGALMDLGRAEEAQQRFEEAIRLHPADATLQTSLARLRWVRGDTTGFARDLEAAVAARPDDAVLRIGCADMLRRADQHAQSEAMLREGLRRTPEEPALIAALAVVHAETGAVQEAVPMLLKAHALRPQDWNLRESVAATLLQAGDPAAALTHIDAALARDPHHAAWLAHKAVALRLLGEEAGYVSLYDYERMVRPYELPLPPGYDTIEAFNVDLARTLRQMHRLDAHPLDQSLRNGTQTSKSLLEVDDPLIRAFLESVDQTLQRHIGAMPDDAAHPFWSRKPSSGRARLVGCWSVRLRPEGFHVNHVHPEGWLSSAYYVSVPREVAGANDHRGWIQFGEPRWPTPGAPPARFVEPRPGRLVIFPSYMWHGTVPFHEGEERLTIAFDAVPA